MTPSHLQHEPLPRSFYDASADFVAPRLLGHYLIRNTPQGIMGGTIVETEAYLMDDPACHSYRGQTARNRSMFGPPGYSYVYLIYGMHFCFNTVCHAELCGEAVLIRAIEVNWGEEIMRERRPTGRREELTNGPAKLSVALAIKRDLDGVDLCDRKSPVFVAANADRESLVRSQGPIITTTRVGISQAALLPLRFYLHGSAFVSVRERRAPGAKAARA